MTKAKDRAIALLAQEFTVEQVSFMTRLAVSTVRNYTKEKEMIEAGDVPLILALAQDGMIAKAIAEKFDTTSEQIKQVCNDHDVYVRTNKRQERSKSEINELIRKMLQTERYSQRYISDTLKVDRTRVLAVQIELGYAVEGKVFNAKRQRMESLSRKVNLLRRDGMGAKDACKAVGISTSSYNRHYKKALA